MLQIFNKDTKKFVGIAYSDDNENYRNHHRNHGDGCVWTTSSVIDEVVITVEKVMVEEAYEELEEVQSIEHETTTVDNDGIIEEIINEVTATKIIKVTKYREVEREIRTKEIIYKSLTDEQLLDYEKREAIELFSIELPSGILINSTPKFRNILEKKVANMEILNRESAVVPYDNSTMSLSITDMKYIIAVSDLNEEEVTHG